MTAESNGQEMKKGIILAGGSGTRLHPVTTAVSKQLLPVFDKPMIYYPLSTLMLAGVQDIMIISTPVDQEQFKRLLGDGSQFGVKFSYAVQEKPEGIPQAFLIAEKWLDGKACALALGDNLIFAASLSKLLERAENKEKGATVFAYRVRDPERYGVVKFDENGKALQVIEKPMTPFSHWAITGLYFYDNRVGEFARKLQPSERGELEITDLNRMYLEEGTLQVEKLGRGCAWFDAGLPESLLQASTFVQTIQSRQGLLVGSPEEAAYRRGFIDATQLRKLADKLKKTDLGRLLYELIEGNSEI
ncbi:glucose-1-phosphate thymidylyltransferase RfbA [Entomobacter blattae]|nr:glucose-1-phosphate thymidylyltransferase RfbA [Entomobacter blattae]